MTQKTATDGSLDKKQKQMINTEEMIENVQGQKEFNKYLKTLSLPEKSGKIIEFVDITGKKHTKDFRMKSTSKTSCKV